MSKARKLEFDEPLPLLEEEDSETLAAIDRGAKAADNGKVIPLEEVRKRMRAWNTESSSRKTR
jgi:predicted transcriptional regulator